MFLELTGTGGASTNLIVPANKKLYFIYNNSTGAVTVKVSGQTGVSVPAAAKVSLVSNGTDVVTATNYMVSATLPSATLSSPTMTGTPIAPTAAAGTNTTQVATTAFVTTGLQAAYPVGSIYISTVSTNPNTLFGFGTWVAFGAGRVLLGDGGGYSAGATGGSADAITVSHTHTASTSITDPGHNHFTTWNNINDFVQGSQSPGAEQSPDDIQGTFNINTNSVTTGISASTSITSTGSSGTGANLQPYVVVYMWNRTA